LDCTFHAKRGKVWIELFLVPYLLLILIWPSRQGLRFLILIVTFVVYLSLLGLRRITQTKSPSLAHSLLFVFVAIIGLSYLRTYRDPNFASVRGTDGQPAFEELRHAILTKTSPTDIFVASDRRL